MRNQRIIKFRVWSLKDRYFWFPQYSGETIFKDVFDRSDDSMVQQFTGLSDKNGKEIYEGDILNVYDFNGKIHFTDEVIWGISEFSFKNDHRSLSTWALKFEIIGNIYENPELIKSI